MKAEDPIEFARQLGIVFREEREHQNLSQNRLSEMAAVGRTGIIMFERGDRMPSIHFCKALADALGLKLSELIARVENTDKR